MANYPDFLTTTGYGTAGGLLGVNCRHFIQPFFPSYQTSPSEKERQEIATEDNRERKYITPKGKQKTYNKEQAYQHMRLLERTMRKTKQAAQSAAVGGNGELLREMKQRYTEQMKEYRRFCKAMELRPQYDRIDMVQINIRDLKVE
jgi:hypothetical protein